MAGFQKLSYNIFFKRNWVYAMFILTGAYAVEQAIDRGVDYYWDQRNQGKLFSHMVKEYKEKGIIQEDE